MTAPSGLDDLPGWILPGAAVVTSAGRGLGREDLVVDYVARLTPTQVVLTGGRRYRRDDLTLVGNRSQKLRSPADPDVVAVLARQAEDKALETLHNALTTYMHRGRYDTGDDGVQRRAAIIAAIRETAATLDTHDHGHEEAAQVVEQYPDTPTPR